MIKNHIYRGRVQGVQNALEAWKHDHDRAMEVRDLEEIVQESCQALESLLTWQRDAWRALGSGQIDRVLEYGEKLREVYDLLEKMIQAVDEAIQMKERGLYTVDHSSEFRQLGKKVRDGRTTFEKNWPSPPTEEKIRAALAAVQRGEFLEVGDWIRELRGQVS